MKTRKNMARKMSLLVATALIMAMFAPSTALPRPQSTMSPLRGGGGWRPSFGTAKPTTAKVPGSSEVAKALKGTRTGVAVVRKGSLLGVTLVAMVYFMSVALAIPALPKLVNGIVGDRLHTPLRTLF